jgi:hypothetical protein
MEHVEVLNSPLEGKANGQRTFVLSAVRASGASRVIKYARVGATRDNENVVGGAGSGPE